MHDWQPHITQGDHGRDLYAFKKTLEGQVPYRDYWWPYGPLMPYYYAFIYKILGISIQSAIQGNLFLQFSCCIVFFLILSRLLSPALSFTGAMFFNVFAPRFDHTYCHTGGILFLLLLFYLLVLYLNEKKKKYALGCFLCLFILALIKINFGIINLMAVSILLFLWAKYVDQAISHHKKFLFAGIVTTALAIGLAYFALVYPLSREQLLQCFPFLPQYRISDPIKNTLWKSIFGYLSSLWQMIIHSWPSMLLFLTFSLASLMFLLPRAHAEKTTISKKRMGIILLACLFFLFLSLHEYFGGSPNYSKTWAAPFEFLFFWLIIGYGVSRLPKIFQISLIIIVNLFVATTAYRILSFLRIQRTQPGFLLKTEYSQVYAFNPFDWFTTVQETTAFLNDHLKEKEEFLAIPYEPFFYFLTNRNSPIWQMNFQDYQNIGQEQAMIIQELEKKHINWILVSNDVAADPLFLSAPKKRDGPFCPSLIQYVIENYTPVISFGRWVNETRSSVDNYAVIIFKRNSF